MPMTDELPSTHSKWWGKFEFDQGETGRWRIGALDLWVSRTALDWRYGMSRSDDALDDSLLVEVPLPDADADELPEEVGRFGFARTEGTIELLPVLADRPIVARPAVPFFVPPGQSIELYVSSPLWIRLSEGDIELAELACTRPSDTWFGTNTRGVLSYALRSRLRRRLEDVSRLPNRAISCIEVENASDSRLALERFCLPAPQLSLFAATSGLLWTEHVRVRYDDDGDLSKVELGKGPPRMAGTASLISAPRASQGRSFASVVFGGLFESGI
ncbi:MAG: hypothetical protein ACI8TQ_003152 [Planctomycetota bacterium]|jgi:hypothetical protein